VQRTQQLFNAAMHEVKAVDSVRPSLLPSMARLKQSADAFLNDKNIVKPTLDFSSSSNHGYAIFVNAEAYEPSNVLSILNISMEGKNGIELEQEIGEMLASYPKFDVEVLMEFRGGAAAARVGFESSPNRESAFLALQGEINQRGLPWKVFKSKARTTMNTAMLGCESVVESLLLEFVDREAPPSSFDAPHVVDIIMFLDNCDVLTSVKIRLYDERRICFKGKTATAVEPVLLYVGGEETFPQHSHLLQEELSLVHNQCYLLRSQPLLWIRSRLRWILADHHGEIVIWGGLGGGSPFRDMISKSLSHYFGDVFLNQSRFDAANLFEIWQQLATRRDSMFVDHDTDPSQRVVISRVAQMDTEVALKFVGKKMARPPPILDSGLFDQDLHDINILIPTMHNLFYCQRTGLNLFLQHIVPPQAPQRNKFLHYLKNMVLLQEKGEINSCASSYRRYVGEIVPLFEKSCEKLSPRLRLFSTIPLLLNWLSFLYYFTDLPYALYLPQLWIVSLSVFLILGDASLEFDGSNVMSYLYGVDLGHAVNFFSEV